MRDEIVDLLTNNPSLKAVLGEMSASAFTICAARRPSIRIGQYAFPACCP
jgi:hypothetical protein